MQDEAPRPEPVPGANDPEGMVPGTAVAPPPVPSPRLGARLRTYFLAGLVIVGPVALTIYIIWWFITVVDAWVKPLVPRVYDPGTYLPFAVPGFGLLFAIVCLTVIGALATNLIGRSLITFGDLLLERLPVVRNLYRALKQIFETVLTAAVPTAQFQKVGLIEFPSKGIWSLVFITGEAVGEIRAARPGGEDDLLSVFMATGVVPPTGFVCFVPRRSVILLNLSVEDAAKIVISAGMATPDYQSKLKELASRARRKPAPEAAEPDQAARNRRIASSHSNR